MAGIVTEYSNLTAAATVTSAPAKNVTTDQDEAEDALLEVEYLLDNVDDLDDEDVPTVQDILDMNVDGRVRRR